MGACCAKQPADGLDLDSLDLATERELDDAEGDIDGGLDQLLTTENSRWNPQFFEDGEDDEDEDSFDDDDERVVTLDKLTAGQRTLIEGALHLRNAERAQTGLPGYETVEEMVGAFVRWESRPKEMNVNDCQDAVIRTLHQRALQELEGVDFEGETRVAAPKKEAAAKPEDDKVCAPRESPPAPQHRWRLSAPLAHPLHHRAARSAAPPLSSAHARAHCTPPTRVPRSSSRP